MTKKNEYNIFITLKKPVGARSIYNVPAENEDEASRIAMEFIQKKEPDLNVDDSVISVYEKI